MAVMPGRISALLVSPSDAETWSVVVPNNINIRYSKVHTLAAITCQLTVFIPCTRQQQLSTLGVSWGTSHLSHILQLELVT